MIVLKVLMQFQTHLWVRRPRLKTLKRSRLTVRINFPEVRNRKGAESGLGEDTEEVQMWRGGRPGEGPGSSAL